MTGLRATVRRARTATLAAVLATACQDGGCRIDESEVVEVLARSYCDGVYAHCDDGPGVSETSCNARMTRGGDARRDELRELASRYDGDCALALREAYESDEIDTEWRAPGQPHPRACPVWVGTRREGEPCTPVEGFDECVPPLACSAEGICIHRDPQRGRASPCSSCRSRSARVARSLST